MVKFDLSELYEKTDMKNALDKINELGNLISYRTSDYKANVSNLTVGLLPGEGTSVSQMDSEELYKYLNTSIYNKYSDQVRRLTEIYHDQIIQYLIATDIIPAAYLYANRQNPLDELRELEYQFEEIISEVPILTGTDALFPYISSFGLVAVSVEGHFGTILRHFLVYQTTEEYNRIITWMKNYQMEDVILPLSISEYEKRVVDSSSYCFLYKFDKLPLLDGDVTFRLNLNLTRQIPSYVLEVGVSEECKIVNPRNDLDAKKIFNLNIISFKKGELVETEFFVPNTYTVAMVVLNGETFFADDVNLQQVGVTLVKTDVSSMNGYTLYKISVSGLTKNSSLYVSACEDFTNRATSNTIFSKKSTIEVIDDGVSMHLITTTPFAYLDKDKLKVYASKTVDSELELIPNPVILLDGESYVTMESTFCESQLSSMKPKQPYGRPPIGIPPHGGKKPPTHSPLTKPDYAPPSNLHYKDYAPAIRVSDRMISYLVRECGSVLISFEGYTDYEYFYIVVDERAMILSYKIPGTNHRKLMIPNKETVTFTNIIESEDQTEPTPEEPTPENPEDGDGSGIDTSTVTMTLTPNGIIAFNTTIGETIDPIEITVELDGDKKDNATLNYQWYKMKNEEDVEYVLIKDATSNVLSSENIDTTAASVTKYRCTISATGTDVVVEDIYSQEFTVTVN